MFLRLNGVDVLGVGNAELYEFVIWVAASEADLPDIAERLRLLVEDPAD